VRSHTHTHAHNVSWMSVCLIALCLCLCLRLPLCLCPCLCRQMQAVNPRLFVTLAMSQAPLSCLTSILRNTDFCHPLQPRSFPACARTTHVSTTDSLVCFCVFAEGKLQSKNKAMYGVFDDSSDDEGYLLYCLLYYLLYYC
jgi:hypothetical protein